MQATQEPLLHRPTFPMSHAVRKKPRRWPLVLRVWKGSIHWDILPALICHSALAAVVVILVRHGDAKLALPGTIVPSLSIVVGLMLVFRNGTSYDRFWQGRNHVTTVVTSVRNLTRTFLVCSAPSYCPDDMSQDDHDVQRQDTETVVRILIAILYSVKHNLRSEWRSDTAPPPERLNASAFGTFSRPISRHHSRTPSVSKPPKLFRTSSGLSIFQGSGLPKSFYAEDSGGRTSTTAQQEHTSPTDDLRRSAMLKHTDSSLTNMTNSTSTVLNASFSTGTNYSGHSSHPPARKSLDYDGLLPAGLGDFEDQGLSLSIQLSALVEAYIHRQVKLGRLTPPQAASQLCPQLNILIDAFGRMETIRTTPLPVAHLIHTKQVLTLYLIVLPFTLVADMGWWSVGIVALITFTLYGIEGIGSQLEDPFGYDRNDVKMDGIVEDARVEGMCLLAEWRRGGGMFMV